MFWENVPTASPLFELVQDTSCTQPSFTHFSLCAWRKGSLPPSALKTGPNSTVFAVKPESWGMVALGAVKPSSCRLKLCVIRGTILEIPFSFAWEPLEGTSFHVGYTNPTSTCLTSPESLPYPQSWKQIGHLSPMHTAASVGI